MAPDLADLSAYFDGELSEADRRAVEVRLASDPEYAREYERLERTRTMLTLAMEQPAFHARLMNRIDARRVDATTNRAGRPRYLVAALAAALAMVVASIVYLSLVRTAPENSLPPGPGNLAVAPRPAASDDSEPMLLAAEPESSAPAPLASAPMETTQLSFTLGGTVTGSAPVAIIAVNGVGGAKWGTYAPGDTIAEGVTLVSVESDKVILDCNGQNVELTKAEAPAVPAPNLSGEWTLHILHNRHVFGPEEFTRAPAWYRSGPDGDSQAEPEDFTSRVIRRTFRTDGNSLAPEDFTVKQEGSRLTAALGDNLIEGFVTGNTVRVTVVLDTGEPFEVEGVLDKDWTECTGQLPPETMGYPEGEDFTFRAARVPADQTNARRLFNDRLNEVKEMARILDAYATRNNETYPPKLEDLVPAYAPNLDAFADTDTRKVQYTATPNVSVKFEDYPKYEDTDASLPIPDRILQWEQRLKASGYGNVVFAKPALVVDYTNPEAKFRVTRSGVAALPDPTSALLEEMRARCSNNLKQLGLVFAMFENEHDGYTPGGWLSCYPEYLADPNVLTSPKDEPGTDSYLYLFPATNMEAYIREAFPDLAYDGDPAGRAKAQAEIPMATNRTEFPGEVPGRFVLFSDGHVEYCSSGQWRARVLPFVQQLGN